MNKTINDDSAGNLHITVGAAPNSNLDLTDELQLVKAAMLYADKVTLCSLTFSTLTLTSLFKDLDDDAILELVAKTVGIIGRDPDEIEKNIQHFKQIDKKRRKTQQELIYVRQMKSQLRKAKDELNKVAKTMLVESNAEGLESALNSKIVDLEYFDISSNTAIQDYYQFIADTIISGDSYPLLDSLTANLIEAAIREGKILPLGSSITKAKQASLTSDLFNRLPSFDMATIDEIIDIRKELDKPLIRFRSAIINFSSEVKNAPWNKEFPHDVEQIYLKHVAPSILDIEETCKSNKLLMKLVTNFAKKPLPIPAASFIGLLISQASQLPDIATQSLAIAAGSAVVGLDALNEWREQQQAVEKNQLYFYYRAEKKLERK